MSETNGAVPDFTPETLPGPELRRPLEPVEAWGGRFYVRRISAGVAATLPDGVEAFAAALVVQSVVYADGHQVWTTEDQALAYPMEDLRPLVVAALRVNGLSDKAVVEKKES